MEVHSSTIYNSQKVKLSQFLSTDKCVQNNVAYCYNEILNINKMNKVLINATTWINFENVKLIERS